MGAAAYMGGVGKRASLPKVSSIYTAELTAIQLSLSIIGSSRGSKYIIATDSLSSIRSIMNTADRTMLLQRVREKVSSLIEDSKTVMLTWIPSHKGIQGNDTVDRMAKEAADREQEFIPIPFRDWYPTIRRRTYEMWKEEWQKETRELRKMKPKPGKWVPFRKETRREEVIVNRLRLEHTRITHSYLFEAEAEGQRPLCSWCGDAVQSVKHILIDCPALGDTRDRCFGPTDMRQGIKEVLGEGANLRNVLNYIRVLGIMKYI